MASRFIPSKIFQFSRGTSLRTVNRRLGALNRPNGDRDY